MNHLILIIKIQFFNIKLTLNTNPSIDLVFFWRILSKLSKIPGEPPEPINNEPDILPEVDLPDDSLADGDLRERDLIDSVQYVYFGRGGQNSGGGGSRSGRWGCAVPGGAAVGAAAIAITAVTLLRHKTFRNSKMFPIEMNILSCFMVTNVLFIIGIGVSSSTVLI